MKKFGESASEIRKNMNISRTIHAIYAQIGRILVPTSEHIVLIYGVNRMVTFRNNAKKPQIRKLKTTVGGVTSSGHIEIPAFVFKHV